MIRRPCSNKQHDRETGRKEALVSVAGDLLKRYRFIIPFIFVALLCMGTAKAQELAGRYKHTGATITYRITVPQQKPAAAIVLQYLPPGTTIQNALPAFSSYDPKTGIVKWLFSDVTPGVLVIELQLTQPVTSQEIKAEVLFKDHQGVSNTFAIEPLPMKRKQLEGC